MVTEVKADNDGKTNADGVTKTLEMMLDRGYGYVPKTALAKACRSTQRLNHGLSMS